MSIKLGDKNISAIYLGDKPIIKAYLGTNLVYESGNGLPCYVQNITLADDMTDCEVEVFYTTNGEVIINCFSNTKYGSINLDSATTMEGITRTKYTNNYVGGHSTCSVFTGITKPCNISLSRYYSGVLSTYYINVLFTETTGNLKKTKNQYIQNITYTGSYTSSTYINQSSTLIGYSESGNILLFMQSGTTTSYENLYICGDNVIHQNSYTTNVGAGLYYSGVIAGVTSNSNIEVQMNSVNSSNDYTKCNVVITEV